MVKVTYTSFLTPAQHEYRIASERSILRRMDAQGLCFCGSGRQKDHCHPNVETDSIITHVFIRLLDLDKAARQQFKDYGAFFRKPHCFRCCENHFKISELEYFVLKMDMEARGDPGLAMLSQIADAATIFGSDDMCLLADTDGRCSCYSARPVVCRMQSRSRKPNACAMRRKRAVVFCGKAGRSDARELFSLHIADRDSYINHVCAIPQFYKGKPVVADNGFVILIEPHIAPLAFWLGCGNDLEEKYRDAIHMPQDEYCRKYFSIDS